MMGTICGGFGTSHILMRRGTAGEGGERAFRGMQELGRRVKALKPDVLVLVSSDHFYNFRGDEPGCFHIGLHERYDSFGDMDIPVRTVRNHLPLARAIAGEALQAGFALPPLQPSYRPDHGVILPYMLVGQPTLPMVPIIVNLAHDPAPTLAQGYQLGQLVRQAIRSGDFGRVVVIGGGGLSHWLGVPEMGRVNAEWDQLVLGKFADGQAEELTRWTTQEIVNGGGNGGLEIVNWMVMAGAMAGARGRQLYYEALPEWMTGMGGVELMAEEGGRHETQATMAAA